MKKEVVKWEAKLLKHHKQSRIGIYFDKHAALIAEIKEIKGVRWSHTLKAWHIPDVVENRLRFKLPEKIIGIQNISKINLVNQKAYQAYIDTLYLKAYSCSTIKTYNQKLSMIDIPIYQKQYYQFYEPITPHINQRNFYLKVNLAINTALEVPNWYLNRA
ncbi:hypothetical protein ACFOWA_17295 [Pedobacter lithocola]|uniref:Uncharacterized protein n=1 Tax=Pedobacter lithocola TaxID=1908239 RepID=A0ABV8PFA5_9SPHI